MAGPVQASCDQSACGRRNRALLLSGFAGALRSELGALQVEDVAVVANGLRLRIARGKTDQAGQRAEIGPPRGGRWRTCPVRAFEAWQAVAKPGRAAVSKDQHRNGIGDTALHPDAVRLILARRVRMGGSLSRGSTGSARTRCTSASSPPPMNVVATAT